MPSPILWTRNTFAWRVYRHRQTAGDNETSRGRLSTLRVERQNLNLRMGMCLFGRLTDAFSRKMANHMAMVVLYNPYYYFVLIHTSLRMTPAMATGLSAELRDME